MKYVVYSFILCFISLNIYSNETNFKDYKNNNKYELKIKENITEIKNKIFKEVESMKINPLIIYIPTALIFIYIAKLIFYALTEESVHIHDKKLISISNNEIYPLCTVLEEEDFAKISNCEKIHKVIDSCNTYYKQNPNSALIKLSKLKRTLNLIKNSMSKFFRIFLAHRLSSESIEVLSNEKLLNDRVDSLIKIVTSNIE
jgi:hypothetical protein